MRDAIRRAMDGENTVLLPVRDYGGKKFVCDNGYAYALVRGSSDGSAMLPVIRGGQAVCAVRDGGPEFGKQLVLLHVFRARNRWCAGFIKTSWLFEAELDKPVAETNQAVADYYDSENVSFSGF